MEEYINWLTVLTFNSEVENEAFALCNIDFGEYRYHYGAFIYIFWHISLSSCHIAAFRTLSNI